MKSRFIACWPALLALAVPGTLNVTQAGLVPYPDVGTPVSVGQELFATGDDVTLTYVGKGTAALTSCLFLVSPSSPYNSAANPIFVNQTASPGTTVDFAVHPANPQLFSIVSLNPRLTVLPRPAMVGCR